MIEIHDRTKLITQTMESRIASGRKHSFCAGSSRGSGDGDGDGKISLDIAMAVLG